MNDAPGLAVNFETSKPRRVTLAPAPLVHPVLGPSEKGEHAVEAGVVRSWYPGMRTNASNAARLA